MWRVSARRGVAGVTRHSPLAAPGVGLLSLGQPFWFLAWRPPGSGLSSGGGGGVSPPFLGPGLHSTPFAEQRDEAPPDSRCISRGRVSCGLERWLGSRWGSQGHKGVALEHNGAFPRPPAHRLPWHSRALL